MTKTIEDIRNLVDPFKGFKTRYGCNSYGYALGIDEKKSRILPYAFEPGALSDNDLSFGALSKEDFISNLELDFRSLNIDYKEIEPDEPLSENEWKIALYISMYHDKYINGFHFLKCTQGNIWTHKNGYYGYISNFDSEGTVMHEPEKVAINNYTYEKCYLLKLKRPQ